MFKNQNEIVVDLILARYKDLITDLEQFVDKINENTSIEDIFGYIDHMLVKLLILFTYENRLIRGDTSLENINHIKDHALLLHDLVKAFEIDDISRDGCLVILKKLLEKIKEHFEEFNNNKSIKEIRMSDLVGQKNYFGCLLFVVCESGFFIKVYGESNEDLLSEMVVRANEYRKRVFEKNVKWGEVLDLRNWKLMTNDSMLLAKENTNTAVERNKKYTIYITGTSKINEFITQSISKEAVILTINTTNIYHTIQAMKQNNIKLGKVLTIDSIGDLSFAVD